VNGTLRVAGVETVEDLHTVNGNIEVFDVGGSVHAHTTNGNVHLELAHLPDKTAPSQKLRMVLSFSRCHPTCRRMSKLAA